MIRVPFDYLAYFNFNFLRKKNIRLNYCAKTSMSKSANPIIIMVNNCSTVN